MSRALASTAARGGAGGSAAPAADESDAAQAVDTAFGQDTYVSSTYGDPGGGIPGLYDSNGSVVADGLTGAPHAADGLLTTTIQNTQNAVASSLQSQTSGGRYPDNVDPAQTANDVFGSLNASGYQISQIYGTGDGRYVIVGSDPSATGGRFAIGISSGSVDIRYLVGSNNSFSSDFRYQPVGDGYSGLMYRVSTMPAGSYVAVPTDGVDGARNAIPG